MINVDEDDPQAAGAVVLILGNDRKKQRAKASSLGDKGAVAAIIAANAERAAQFQQRAKELPALPVKIEGQDASGLGSDFNLLEVSPEAAAILKALPENTTLTFDGPSTSEKKIHMECGRHPARQRSGLATNRGVALGPSGSPGNRPAGEWRRHLQRRR